MGQVYGEKKVQLRCMLPQNTFVFSCSSATIQIILACKSARCEHRRELRTQNVNPAHQAVLRCHSFQCFPLIKTLCLHIRHWFRSEYYFPEAFNRPFSDSHGRAKRKFPSWSRLARCFTPETRHLIATCQRRKIAWKRETNNRTQLGKKLLRQYNPFCHSEGKIGSSLGLQTVF